mgnify:CR=1 FL=1
MTNQKIKIAVRMPDKSRRLYVVDDAGMTPDEMRAATVAEVPTAAVVLIGIPAPVPFLAPEAA